MALNDCCRMLFQRKNMYSDAGRHDKNFRMTKWVTFILYLGGRIKEVYPLLLNVRDKWYLWSMGDIEFTGGVVGKNTSSLKIKILGSTHCDYLASIVMVTL
jgi:hypothetical protein